ncbi:hypothetical protein CERSUDRAFT_97025 [Gelatoporia subvermispora B]|uniref:Uncharacterized protein n=1 Tax=Ceriporiopsis subvermispora (strain B) TaxID=914234 RepID=M2PGH3_CERS8|nr:hypothetical protein CERSUDRAFT_97025 [Gelatoporia subvermispora B]
MSRQDNNQRDSRDPPRPSQRPRVNPPDTHPSQDAGVLPLDQVTFNPVGVFFIARILAPDRAMFNRYRPQFEAAALGWFVAGAHADGNHNWPANMFHSLWRSAREGTRDGAERCIFRDNYRAFVMDILTVWDRFTGGVTVMTHIDRTLLPGTIVRPENLRANVYVAPTYLRELPAIHSPITRMVQLFLEGIAPPGISMATSLAELVFWGRPDGELDRIAPTQRSGPVAPSASYQNPNASLPIDWPNERSQIYNEHKAEVAELRTELGELRRELEQRT